MATLDSPTTKRQVAVVQFWPRARAVTCAWFGAVWVFGVVWSANAADLHWRAPAECSEHEFTTRLELVLGSSLSQVKDRQLKVDVTHAATNEWSLSFSWLDREGKESGRRELHGTGCADVTRAGAVAAAMALQADEAAEPQNDSEPQPAAKAATSPTAVRTDGASTPGQPPVTNDTASTRQRDARGTSPWLVNLAVVGDAGTLAAPALGASLNVGVHWTQLSMGVGGVAFPLVYREARAGQGGDFTLFSGQAWVCVRPASKQWVPLGCANYELGALSGRGAGAEVNRRWSRTALWQAVRPELGLAIPMGWDLELDVRLGVSIALTRPDFVLDGELSILRPQRFSPRAALGLTWAP